MSQSLTRTIGRIGDQLIYPVAPADQGVSVRIEGPHRGYSLVCEGSSAGPGGPWVKLPSIYFSLPGGRYEQHPGAYHATTFNEAKYFAVDTRFPVPLTHVRLTCQQWFGVEGNALAATATGMPSPPRAVADTGGAVAFDELRGKLLAVPVGFKAAASGATREAHVGSDYRQLMVGFNLTALTDAPAGVTFAAQTRGADEVWYTLWESPAVTAAPWQTWVSIGAALDVSRMFTNMVRLAWTLPAGGGAEFSASVMAKTLPP
jgi:hypothetical protein